MNKKKKRKKIILIFGLLTIILAAALYFFLFKKVISGEIFTKKIKGYEYKLELRDSELSKTKFELLENILSEKTIDYEKYAQTIAEMFVIDFFSLDNKKNQYDIGGLEFIFPENRNSFLENAEDTIYKYYDKKNEYPMVTEIISSDVTKTEFDYDSNKIEAYDVNISWNYDKDLGYDKAATVSVIRIKDKLYVGSYEGGK